MMRVVHTTVQPTRTPMNDPRIIRPLVGIETPWKGLGAGYKAERYLRNALRDSLARGELPWASHCMLAQSRALYDEDLDQREEGLLVNQAFIQGYATCIVFYVDHGMSEGMERAWIWAGMYGKSREKRKLYQDQVNG